MKRIGILSDTHAWWDDRYATYFAGCDEIWHAGDIGSEEVLDRLCGIAPVVRAVYGNIDGAVLRRRLKEVEIFTTEGVKVLMKHIGGYPGRYDPSIRRELTERPPQLFISGHSHILRIKYDRTLRLLHINPGAAGMQGWQKERTIVRLTIDGAQMKDCEVVTLG